ncbi:Na+/H+ antiporter subunit E [Arsenicitalea aurantiaca]|uniref:Na+/H+ antiporter subunit E n=1 Tax=Arsenicitalea aurantiaca TaxID=1783274 RepID=A0A433XAB5_9HYPH|nr:Na+/H+ antiporter subunit E [Arsenicitalea aurantiaca]RUT31031.1 Na+/H+ antiporter subunit E [Arsenicitalea aurantiaca]
MSLAGFIIGMAILWAAIGGSFTLPNLLFGGLVGGIAALLLRNSMRGPASLRRLGAFVSLAWLFLVELMISATKVALLVLRPDLKQRLSPGIIAYPLKARSDVQITVLANLITLTPGTLSVDVSDDRSTLFIHALEADDADAVIAAIASGFEAKVMEVFG